MNYNESMKLKPILQQSIAILFLAVLTACSTSLEGTASTEIPPTAANLNIDNREDMATPDLDWVIFTREQAEEMGLGSWLVESAGFWTPSENDIIILEESIAVYLSEKSFLFYGEPPEGEQLAAYQRQFIGIEHDGSRIIYGNYFCNSLGIDWRQKIVSVDDGGDCYFQVKYDVDSGMFTMLMVNGQS